SRRRHTRSYGDWSSDVCSSDLLERRLRDRCRPIYGDEFSFETNLRLQQTVFGFKIFEVESAVIAHPCGIDVIVLARCLPIDHVLAGPDDRVTPGGTARADTFCFFQKPDAHFESKIRRGQRANWTNIDSVEGVIVFEPLARMRREHGVTAAIDKSEDVVVCNFLAKTDAT